MKLDEMSRTQGIYRGNNKRKNEKSLGKSITKRPVFQLAFLLAIVPRYSWKV
jgi:hypothetical protein